MTLPLPKLDSRTYDDLLKEALRRLPLHTPEYTNHNASDPGHAILATNAYLTETLLYQINRVPEQNYVAFLNLIGIGPRPAEAARANLSFVLKDLKEAEDPLLVDIPLGSQVAVDDPDLPQEVVFETDRAMKAINADFGLALAASDTGSDVWKAVTEFDSAGEKTAQWLHAFHPFSAAESDGKQFLFALALRPKTEVEQPEDRMPTGPLDLFVEATEVFETDASGDVITGPVTDSSGPLAKAPDAGPLVEWEVFAADSSGAFSFGGVKGWVPLNVSHDETHGLSRTGRVTLEIPSGMVGVDLADAPESTWAAMEKSKAPQDKAALIAVLDDGSDRADAIKDALTEEMLTAMGVSDAAGLLSNCADAGELAGKLGESSDPINPKVLSQETWATIHPEFDAPKIPTIEIEKDGAPATKWLPLYMFRVTLRDPKPDAPRLLNRLRLNTVAATAASTRRDERLGASNGRPGQTMRLARAPVYFDPLTGRSDITLTVTHDGVVEEWSLVDDFYGYDATSKVYLLNPETGEVQFGDGRPNGIGGAIPPNKAVVRAARYRFGGGQLANVAKGTITKIKGALSNVDAVSNERAAAGGADGETFDQVLRRAPSTLRRRERAVSARDFAELAQETPGAAIHKAYAVAAKVPSGTGFAEKAGAVSVVVLPNVDHPTPQPDEDILAAVRGYLNPRRLISTELHIMGPNYFHITSLTMKLKVDANSDFSVVSDAARAALTTWLHPLRGGPDGTGWEFGSDIFHADLYDLLLAIPGVRRVQGLNLSHDAVTDVVADDVIAVPEGYLPALDPGAIGVEVSYA